MSDMQLRMIITGSNQDLNRILNQSDRNVRRFTDGAATHFTRLQSRAQKVWSAINGMSAATKMIATGIGIGTMKSVIDGNLKLEETLLEAKQLAGMTTRQVLEMRNMSLAKAGDLLAAPQEIADGIRILANASMKFDQIKGTIIEAARAALLFRSSIATVANMDYDMETKFNVDPSQVRKAHEILYYHSKSGRFEAKSLSEYAPQYLNAFKSVGVGGMGGINFVGAVTQVVQQAAPATQPGAVATMIEQGLSHIYSEHIDKKLKKETGIDMPKFAPHGKFYGKDGVPGLLDLATAMRNAGLLDDFKLQRAGFRESESRHFWQQLMRNVDVIRDEMRNAERDAGSGIGDRDVKEIKESNFGKIRAAEVQVEKMKVSEAAQSVTTGAGDIAGMFSEHPALTFGTGVAAVIGGKYLMNKLLNGKGAGGALGGAMGAAGVVPVFVTNWPESLTGKLKTSERLARRPSGAAAAEGAADGAATRSGLAALVLRALTLAAPALLLSGDSADAPKYDPDWSARTDEKMARLGYHREKGWLFDSYVPDKPGSKPAAADQVVAAVQKVGEKIDALNQRPVTVAIDGREVAHAVNQVNSRDSRRQ